MKTDCLEMKRRIESALGCAPEPNELDEIERHCEACGDCRAYRERLIGDDSKLAELAAHRAESIGRVRARAIERVRAAERVPGRRSGSIFARTSRYAAIAVGAAAAVIVAFVAIDLIRGAANGPVPAFAAVQEKMQKADNVVNRVRLWRLGEWITYTESTARPWRHRRDFVDSVLVHGGGDKSGSTDLRLYPSEKRAVVSRVVYKDTCSTCWEKRKERPDAVDVVTGWCKQKGFVFVRKERYEGKEMAVYERASSTSKHRVTAWVDLETELLARLEVVSPRRGPNADTYGYGLRLRDFLPSGGKATGWIELKPDEPCMILDNFKWNEISDTSLFSTVPPAGYRVENECPVDFDELRGHGRARRLAQRLRCWLDLSGNAFPDDIHDLDDSTKVKPLLIAKFRRGGEPTDEFRAALRYAETWERTAVSPRSLEQFRHTPIHYSAKGAEFGDSKRAICWVRVEEEPYYVIYADLHVAASPTQPKLAGE